MKLINNLTQYSPKKPIVTGARYLKSDDGTDWYEAQKSFQDSTMKIVFNPSGIIISMSYDVSALWPEGNSVAEISASEIPEDLSINGEWIFDGKNVIPKTYSHNELFIQAKKKRNSLMAGANEAIIPLQDAVDINAATDDELNRLKAWKTYRVALNRLDLSTAPDITWPDIPA
ncbi:virus tail fiber assembly protein lambda gpK [Rahnella sp. BIGb0236]|uniref:tail fiber assembly protein n=1 Tax=Rahnella sp. BIGb0236 TaxID=2485117 RepID=UPI00105E338A|nr:tail fiber assembly protein [Rahnella sp. BIGb0236]TDS90542.1 virus tail fiber assembly protein lambda gpK [Rahnella sp. BIGb0236]